MTFKQLYRKKLKLLEKYEYLSTSLKANLVMKIWKLDSQIEKFINHKIENDNELNQGMSDWEPFLDFRLYNEWKHETNDGHFDLFLSIDFKNQIYKLIKKKINLKILVTKNPQVEEKRKQLNLRYFKLKDNKEYTKSRCLDILEKEFPNWTRSTIETYLKK